MKNDAILHGPEAVQEHQQVRKQEKKCDPQNRGKGHEEFVGAGVHQGMVTSVEQE
jgi:hypothetical protein